MYGDAYQYDILDVKVEKVLESVAVETEQNKDGEKETIINKDGVPETADAREMSVLMVLAVVSLFTVICITRKEAKE
jgi:hypothetical protein